MPRNYSRTRAWGCAANAGGTPEECKLIDSLNRLAKKWEKDGKRLWLYSASGVLTVMMHGDREDNPIPEMLPNAGTNPDNIITTISGIGNDGGDW